MDRKNKKIIEKYLRERNKKQEKKNSIHNFDGKIFNKLVKYNYNKILQITI